jgi:glucose-6-phosphate-specific signal transduction histidine kinase
MFVSVAVNASLTLLGIIVGYIFAYLNRSKLPTNEQLAFTNALYQRKAHSYQTLVHDVHTGLDQIGQHVAAIQISRPNKDFDRVIDAITDLQHSITQREEEGGLLRPTEEALKSPFDVVTEGV